MDYLILSLITDKNYFDNIQSMINIKVLSKMSYEIFTTNMKRHEIISKLFKKLFDHYGLDRECINDYVNDSNDLKEIILEISDVLLNISKYYSTDYLLEMNCYKNKILYYDDKLSPFKHLKIMKIIKLKKQLKKSPLLQMALDHPVYQKKNIQILY
jgi:hypothetical protein